MEERCVAGLSVCKVSRQGLGLFSKPQRGESAENQAEAEPGLPSPVSSLTLKSVTFHVQRADKYREIMWGWRIREVWETKDWVREGFVKRITGWGCLTELNFITDASQP